jgi:hypothetical protein
MVAVKGASVMLRNCTGSDLLKAHPRSSKTIRSADVHFIRRSHRTGPSLARLVGLMINTAVFRVKTLVPHTLQGYRCTKNGISGNYS